MVFYRKYRPQNFGELVGQEHVKQSLMSALGQGSVAHAYLFCGPRGCGKTTTARILAKALNCERLESGSKKASSPKPQASNAFEPCNECANCIAINNGSHLDVIEIDAASNRGIDDMRELRERISLAPGMGRKKVYIIDEVHMLTTEAFNALLKTLEEPPEHTVLVLATTEPQKIPQTIISRCQRFDFSLATSDELKKALSSIIESEKLQIGDDVLEFLAEKADGSFRDGVKLLDQAASLGQKITMDLVSQTMQQPRAALVEQFFDYIVQNQETEALAFIGELYQKGENLHQFCLQFIRFLRELLLIQARVGETLVKPAKTPAIYKKMQTHSANLDRAKLILLVTIFSQRERELKTASIAQLPLELGVLESIGDRATKAEKVVEKAAEMHPVMVQKPAKIGSLEQEIVEKTVIKPEEIGAMLADKSDSIVQESDAAIEEEIVSAEPKIAEKLTEKRARKTDTAAKTDVSVSVLTQKWPAFLALCLEKNHSAALLLKNATVAGFDEDVLILEVAYKFHKERIEEQKTLQFLEDSLEQTFGAPIRIAVNLGQRPKKAKETEESQEIALQIFGGDMVE